MNSYCTIVTPDYSPFAASLITSLQAVKSQTKKLYVLVAVYKEECQENLVQVDGIEYVFLNDLCKNGLGKSIKDKYYKDFMDEFRWSMKSVFIKWLIEFENYNKVIYLDCDLFFYNNPDFLFDDLENNSVILTPHWRSSNPHSDLTNFKLLYSDGLFNGGFIGVNKDGIDALIWWAETCLYVCHKDEKKVFGWVDQTHLNMIPVYFEGVKIIRHKGCNVAFWNNIECRRSLLEDGSVLINKEFPIVFIHFTTSTLFGILEGKDNILKPYLDRYRLSLLKFEPKLDIVKLYYKRDAESRIREIEARKEQDKMWRNNLTLIRRIRLFLSNTKQTFFK